MTTEVKESIVKVIQVYLPVELIKKVDHVGVDLNVNRSGALEAILETYFALVEKQQGS